MNFGILNLLLWLMMFLSNTVSTVALESIFCVGGQVINQFRNALKPDVVEALVCSKDWLYANIGNVFFIYMLTE